MIKFLLLGVNIVNTNSSYDAEKNAPFRVEQIRAKVTEKNITLDIDYYINTRMATQIELDANEFGKRDSLSPTQSKHSLRNIKTVLPNTFGNTKVDFKFAATWSEAFKLDGTFYFDANAKEEVVIDEPGEYEYKVVNEIRFNNRNGKFTYGYDYINFEIPIDKFNKTMRADKIFINNTDKQKVEYKLFSEANLLERSIITKSINSEKTKKPGNYNISAIYNYRKGAVKKTIQISYDYFVAKNIVGECENSLFCWIEERGKDGKIEYLKKETLVL